jgi:hypothetical protein
MALRQSTQSNFSFGPTGVENLAPLPGESKHYVQQLETDAKQGQTEYGVIKMLTSPYGFRTLLLAGATSTGTAGVAEFFADCGRMKDVYTRIRSLSPHKAFPADWEVLIKVRERDRMPVQTSVVAVRPAR